MTKGLATELFKLLDEERTAIKAADFDSLAPLSDAKVALFDELSSISATKTEFARIQMQLAENQALLAAAIAGVNAARGRIAALQNIREGLAVYDQSGQMAPVPTRRPELEKKA